MNILDIVKGALNVLGDVVPGVGGIFKDAASAINTIPPEQQAAVQTALMTHQEAMANIEIERLKVENETLKTQVSEALAEINSTDKFTSRARPAGVYAATLITTGIGGSLCYCLVSKVQVDLGAIGAILSLLTPLWGSAAYYTKSRSDEKLATIKANAGSP